MVDALDARPVFELLSDFFGLKGPTVTTDLRDDLVIVLEAPVLGSVLIGLAIQHERVHGPLDFARNLSLFNLPTSFN